MKSGMKSIITMFSALVSILNPLKHASKKPKEVKAEKQRAYNRQTRYRSTFSSSRQFHYFSRNHYKLN